MNNAFYISLSKQTAQFRQMAVIANNIANANTTGYKSEKMVFADLIRKDAGGQKISFANDVATVRNMGQGEVNYTGSPLDLAIDGKAFITVDTPQGHRFTRAGSMAVSASGELMTAEGLKILSDSGGPLTIPEQATDLTIREDGMIQVFVDDAEEEVGKIGMVKFDNPNALVIEGSGLYDGSNPLPTTEGDFRIVHKALEGSNVHPVQELTSMIEVARSTEGLAKAINDMNDMLSRAIDIISKQV